jgi:hypothetical protein
MTESRLAEVSGNPAAYAAYTKYDDASTIQPEEGALQKVTRDVITNEVENAPPRGSSDTPCYFNILH